MKFKIGNSLQISRFKSRFLNILSNLIFVYAHVNKFSVVISKYAIYVENLQNSSIKHNVETGNLKRKDMKSMLCIQEHILY